MLFTLIAFSFYANFCGQCMLYKTIWDEIDIMYTTNTDIKIRRVDCRQEQQSQLCFKQNVRGVPSPMLYKNGEFWKEYNGARDLEELVDFIDSHLSEDTIPGWEEREAQRELEFKNQKALKVAQKLMK